MEKEMKSKAFEIGLKAVEAWPTGSKYICDPPVLNTDEDYVVLTRPGREGTYERFGFVLQEGSDLYLDAPMFNSYRKGNVNLIVTSYEEYYYRYKNATEAAKLLNIKDKDKRIEFFQAALYPEIDNEVPL